MIRIRKYNCIQKKENYKTRHTTKSYFSWPNTITLGWRHRFVLQIRLIWNQNWDYLPDIKVGKGEERTINKVIKHAFKNPVHLLCTKHLKDNVHRFLYDKEGCSTKDREFVLCMFLFQSKTDAATFNLELFLFLKYIVQHWCSLFQLTTDTLKLEVNFSSLPRNTESFDVVHKIWHFAST